MDEDHRYCGIGRGLLEAAIAETILRRGQCVWVLSYDFRGKDFTSMGVPPGRGTDGLAPW